jgi:hypothetical protein
MKEFREYILTEAYSEKYYTPSKTLKIESNVGIDIGNVKVERTKNILEVTEKFIKRMKVETQ